MVKPLTFKGDKKPKKRKRTEDGTSSSSSKKRDLEVQQQIDDAEPADDDTWVSAGLASDVTGPVMIVLPSDTPTAVACDAAGKVFALPIENIVDGNAATSEPHDVRMVWVANKIAGTDHFRFRGHHGRYLAADRVGLLSAASEAISPLETWDLVATADTPGTFQVMTQRETFLSVKDTGAKTEVRADADEIGFATTVRVRMQARFKPRSKTAKEDKELAKISRRELEDAVGRRLNEDEVKILKRARREGDYHEKMMDMRVKGKHDKFT